MINKTGRLTVTVSPSNTVKFDGEEIIQLYIRNIASFVVRLVKELRGFEKVFLKAGETKTIRFTLTEANLSFFDAEGNVKLEPGQFTVFVGSNSRDVMEKGFELK